MGPIYDIVIIIGDLILILMFFYMLTQVGLEMMEYFALADSRLIQEYTSGYLSMSNYAPDQFSSQQDFPKITHKMTVTKDPPLINIKVGSFLDRPIKFTPKSPLGYTLSDAISLRGDCVEAECTFSDERLNKIRIIKNYGDVLLSLLPSTAVACPQVLEFATCKLSLETRCSTISDAPCPWKHSTGQYDFAEEGIKLCGDYTCTKEGWVKK